MTIYKTASIGMYAISLVFFISAFQDLYEYKRIHSKIMSNSAFVGWDYYEEPKAEAKESMNGNLLIGSSILFGGLLLGAVASNKAK